MYKREWPDTIVDNILYTPSFVWASVAPTSGCLETCDHAHQLECLEVLCHKLTPDLSWKSKYLVHGPATFCCGYTELKDLFALYTWCVLSFVPVQQALWTSWPEYCTLRTPAGKVHIVMGTHDLHDPAGWMVRSAWCPLVVQGVSIHPFICIQQIYSYIRL